MEATPEVMWGKTLAANRQLADLGGVLGPLTIGVMLDVVGQNAAAASGGGIIVAYGLLGAYMLTPRKPQEGAVL